MNVSEKGIKILKEFEGCVLYAYDDLDGFYPHKKTNSNSKIKGTLTIGYGHTGSDVYKGQEITPEEAEKLLKMDLIIHCNNVNKLVKVPLNQNQFDALVCLEYNIGYGQFSKSTLLKKLNEKNYKGAAEQFLVWNKSGGKVLNGLVKRRTKERLLFLS